MLIKFLCAETYKDFENNFSTNGTFKTKEELKVDLEEYLYLLVKLLTQKSGFAEQIVK